MAIIRIKSNSGKLMDSEKTIQVIEQLKSAHIGKDKKWNLLIKKLKGDLPLNPGEIEYYTRLTRIYKNSHTSAKSKMYHIKLSQEDEKPPCIECGGDSAFYCNMNDQYFCTIHLVGHDENEL